MEEELDEEANGTEEDNIAEERKRKKERERKLKLLKLKNKNKYKTVKKIPS